MKTFMCTFRTKNVLGTAHVEQCSLVYNNIVIIFVGKVNDDLKPIKRKLEQNTSIIKITV